MILAIFGCLRNIAKRYTRSMPQIDLPLDELHAYTGRNPKPSDFDAYWDQALADLDAVDPEVELIPAEFQTPSSECFHLYFTGVGGARVYAKYVRPKKLNQPMPGVLHFHGYTCDSGDWKTALPFIGEGMCHAALDCRGQGGRSQDVGGQRGNTLNGHFIRGLEDAINGEPDKFYYRNVFLDTAQLARIISSFDEVDADRLGAWGGSQGGGLTLACCALHPKIKRAMPWFPFLSDYQRVWEMDLAKDAYKELQQWFKRFDPLHEREADVFNALGYIDVQHLAPRIQSQVEFTCGLMDTVCPPSTQFAVYNKLTCEKQLIILPDFGHENLPGQGDRVLLSMLQL